MNAMKTMIEKASKLSEQELMGQAKLMSNCFEDYADDVLTALLCALEKKIPVQAFVNFCDSL